MSEQVTAPSIDAYLTTGSSPTRRPGIYSWIWPGPEARRGNGHPVTIHLLGPGRVGRALLAEIDPAKYRLVAVTDTTGTLYAPHGLDTRAVIAHKAGGGGIAGIPGAWPVRGGDIARVVARARADIVIDTTATRFDRPDWAAALNTGALERGAALVLAAKDALCAAPAWWDDARVGCNAVLGGTGRALAAELDELRRAWADAALAGNASTTAIIEAIEAGASLDDGIARAGERGFLEPDPELDLRGTDAAVKLAIVHGALTGESVSPADVPCEDIRDIDPNAVRERAARGLTTRLIGRLARDGAFGVSYEAVPRGSPLATPCGRVAYAYRLDTGELRVHSGAGLGSIATARAALEDLYAIAGAAVEVAP